MRYLPAALALLAVALIPADTWAQEDEAQATHVVMRYFKCSPQDLGVQMFQQGRGVVEEMVEEGKFADYGVLAHNWGDEWNVMDWFAVDGLSDFFANFSEMMQRLNAMAPAEGEGEEELPPFNEVCTEHKDNIWTIIDPPSEG